MAETQVTPIALQWGTRIDGRFYINVVVPVRIDGKGPVINVPLYQIILTPEERESLLKSLTGLHTALSLPGDNPQEKLH